MMKTNFFIFVLLFAQLFLSSLAEICPAPIIDDIGTSYNSKKRFDKIRAAKSELVATHNHHGNEYKYTVNLCGENDAVAVERNDESGNKITVAKMTKAAALIGGEDWLLLQYFDGDKYPKTHCGASKRQAWISVKCEEHGEKPQLRVIEEAVFRTGERHKDVVCYYLFQYNHPAACSNKTKKTSLSGTSIFVVIAVVLFCVYLILGIVYKRFVLHAKGMEQVPNIDSWRKLGNGMADGCSFVCRKEEPSNTYKGMADALDIDTTDDEDKDTLLPM